MMPWHDDRPSAVARLLPVALLAVAIALAVWAIPALLRAANTERTRRAVADASERLGAGNVLREFNAALRDIAAATEPSVVHVSVAAEARGRLGTREYTQSGSGWVWDGRGHVVTNAHVVDGAGAVEVQLNDGSIRRATVQGLDLRTDIAVLRVDPADLHPAARSARTPEQGDLVFAFGSPFEYRFSMSSGIVSGVGRSAGIAEVEYENFIQVDAAINPGNSGGPLVDIEGRVIGMNTAIATGRGASLGAGQFAGIGLAIPMQIVENVVEQIIEHGSVAKGFLGVGVSEVGMSGFLAQQGQGDVLGAVARLYRGEGAVVTRISPGSPAERAGLRIGDVIMSVGGRRIATREQVLSQVGTSRPGSLVALDVWRPVPGEERGERLQITAELATLDPTVNAEPLMDLLRRAGLERLSDARGPVRGVLVGTVRDGSSLVERLPAGSVITAVDGQSVASLDDLMVRFIRNASTRVRLQGPTTVRFTVRLPNGAVRDVDVDLDSARETR
jgi:S1-C subfamily serine protease